ncbi:syntaxin-binding protein 5-like isoform X4 [Haliotis cracherodii]|uniref:syntaxin-binding protein 5-like isoform X4 n=1 Tax=Haliotis cracherodii TaxID=6455 RepID=UPI0039ED6684
MSTVKGKRFTLKGVLDGLRSSVSTPPKAEMEIEESLRSEHFQVCKTVRHGFPFQPTAVAFDPVQHILAIGTKSGSLRILGRPGVDCHCVHDSDAAIIQILFLVNEGALVTVCSDDSLHLWNYRQKRPEIVHSLKFQRERITFCHRPFQSKWLYIGTERGNVHIVNIESFILSGYVINWNKAIELSRKTHPGPVVHLSDNPIDASKLLIGFESGTIVLWDLKNKIAETRYSSPEALRSIAWHHEGKQFMCSHSDGSLTTWGLKPTPKPMNSMFPHAKLGKDGKPDPCKPITKVDWKSIRNGEPLVIFSGGMSYDRAGRTPSITVMNGRSTTVLEMEHNVVDFVVLCETPWSNDFQDPYAIVVLLQNDLVVVDLTSPGYPCFENPYPMDLHESPVTACQYYADCPPDLIPAFYSVGSKQKKTGFTEKQGWPVQGGEWPTLACSYPEIIITGHADGSLKFWDASAVTLQVLYKLKTAKIFEKPKKTPESQDDDPFAIQMIYMCSESRLLCVAGASHCMLFKFSKQEANLDIPFLETSIVYEIYDDLDSPEYDYPKPSLGLVTQTSGSMGSYSSNTSDSAKSDHTTSVKVKTGSRKWSAGYQPDLVCVLTWVDGEPPGNITSILVNSTYGLMAFGNESGLAIIDFMQRTCLLNLGTPDLYGSMDPYQRAPRSPRGKKPQNAEGVGQNSEESKSPTTDQSSPPSMFVTSPVPAPRSKKKDDSKGGANPPPPRPPPPKHRATSGDLKVISECSIDSNVFPLQNEPFSPYEIVVQPGDPLFNNSLNSDKTGATLAPFRPKAHSQSGRREPKQEPSQNVVSDTSASEGLDDGDTTPPIHDPDSIGPDPLLGSQKPAMKKCMSDTTKIRDDQVLLKTRKLVRRSSSDPDLSALPSNQGNKKSFIKRIRNSYKGRGTKEKDSCSHHNKSDSDSPRETVRLEVADSHENQVTVFLADETLSLGVEQSPTAEGKECDSVDASGKGFLRKMSTKIRSMGAKPRSSEADGDDDAFHVERDRTRGWRDQARADVIDLRENGKKPLSRRISLVDLFQGKKLVTYLSVDLSNKSDGVSFSRSRSSSMSSLENVSKEAIQSLMFADSYTRKTGREDNFTCPCLWVGTSLGSVIVIVLNLPPTGEQRLTQPVIVSPSGTIFRLKGAILAMSFLDCNGVLIPSVSETWKESPQRENRDSNEKALKNRQMSLSNKPRISPTSSTEMSDRQFVIICSEKQGRVMSLPSQTCAYKVKITETSFVVRAEVVAVRDSVCLMCYVANGHIMAFSLPSLKPILDVDFLPLTDYRVARTFCFSNSGHALYLCSPTEVQKITYSADISETLNDMLGDLFLACETPDAPKQGFFKNLFSGGPSTLDREELFGENSGKASKGLAKHVPGSGLQHLQAQSGAIGGEIARARMALVERGEKIGDLDDKSAQMLSQAESFAQAAHQIMSRYKDKKWYQF